MTTKEDHATEHSSSEQVVDVVSTTDEKCDTESTATATNTTTAIPLSDEKKSDIPQVIISDHDQQLINEADGYYKNEEYFKASACLKKVQDRICLSSLHHNIIEIADQAAIGMLECMIPSDDTILEQNGYYKQTEIHNNQFDTSIHYKVDDNTFTLTSRLESLIEIDLLIPLISVLNESDLYETWMPKFTFPFHLGIMESKKLGEYGRGNQIILVTIQMPYPFATRQIIQHAIAIDTIDEHNAIMVQVNTLQPGKHLHNINIEEPKKGIVRIDEEISMLIRACPKDHPLYIKKMEKLNKLKEEEEKKLNKKKNKKNNNKKGSTTEVTEEDIVIDEKINLPSLILITTLLQADAHVSAVPQRFINFCTRTVLSSFWHSLLHVAEEVRDGKRIQHTNAIHKQQELYNWIEQRTNVMIENLKKHEQNEMI